MNSLVLKKHNILNLISLDRRVSVSACSFVLISGLDNYFRYEESIEGTDGDYDVNQAFV